MNILCPFSKFKSDVTKYESGFNFQFWLQITGEADNDSVMEERPIVNENGLIDIDKLSPIHCTPTKSSDRVDGDGAIWQKIHAEDSML